MAKAARAVDATVDENSLADPELAACTVAVVSRWHLPLHPSAQVSLGFPIVLVPAP